MNEKLRILGEIPLRKFVVRRSPIRGPEGNLDTSFLARVPADSSLTFLSNVVNARLYVQVADAQGNVIRPTTTFSILPQRVYLSIVRR